MTIPAAIPLAIIGSAALAASYCDIRFRTIPQWLVVVISVAGVAGQTIGSGWPGLFSAVEAGTLALLVLGVLYLAGAMGGGDVKLFASISCAVGMNELWVFGRITGVLGGLLALFYLAGGARCFGDGSRALPYGVAVGAGGIITLIWFRQ
jgi:prepilin peptidase CpaA